MLICKNEIWLSISGVLSEYIMHKGEEEEALEVLDSKDEHKVNSPSLF